MKILITGGNGYIARSLRSALTQYDITVITRQDFDLTNYELADAWFADKFFDVVIHTAMVGGSRLKSDDPTVETDNLAMFFNLVRQRSHIGKLITFGSGAEIFHPDTPYGHSKAIIADYIKTMDSWYNLRIFAVFDENETSSRFIKSNLVQYLNNRPMVIHQNKQMDFFYMKDLVSLVRLYIERDDLPKTIDCTYEKKHTLYDIAQYINHLGSHRVEIEIQEPCRGSPYIGNGLLLNMDLVGLNEGIIEVYEKLKALA